MHSYRTHKCGELRQSDVGSTVKLSGWIHRKRDHGGVLFIDLRDTYGITQCVVENNEDLERARVESVITITGDVKARIDGTVNSKMPTGEIEVYIKEVAIQSHADVIPFQVAEDDGAGEDVRLKYRYLDLRREGMHKKIRLRNNVVSSMRQRMVASGFQEFQTPILTASSPEGARDYLVPSRLHPGKFYALPQAPQQFKQLLMMSGFDRYFQIAPCFRDEDGRADRLAEFYQLDVEMSFVTQDDVFAAMEPVIGGIFEEFNEFTGEKRTVTKGAFPRITYADAMMKYGSDKPDLRNPLEIVDVTDVFRKEDFMFKGIIEKGGVVRAIKAPQVEKNFPNSFFTKLNDWAISEGAKGLLNTKYKPFFTASMAGQQINPVTKQHDPSIIPSGAKMEFDGPIKNLSDGAREKLKEIFSIDNGDAIFFVCDVESKAAKMAGKARDKIAADMDIVEKNTFKLCWIVDFPMYEMDEKTNKIDFSHNPFSMCVGGLDALNTQDPLTIMAMQYDCVCNGYELCSGGIRNHKPEIMEKAFAIAGYDKDVLEAKFGGMLNAFRYGAPPHGGCAFGIDRIVMLLANEPNLREVYAFVMNGQYEDPLMNAPTAMSDAQLKDLHLKLNLPKKVEAA